MSFYTCLAMDNRQPLARTTSASLPHSPYASNMASTYSMPYQNTHLPPIQTYAPNMPPHNQSYMPQYRPELPRYQSAPAPSPTPDRYGSHLPPQHAMSGLPPASMLPQPTSQAPQQQSFSTPPSAGPAYPPQQPGQPPQQSRIAPALAPAPPRPNLDPLSTNFSQAPERPGLWAGAEQIPPMSADGGLGHMPRDPNVHHVVGSQGRRGILPSAPGRAPVMPNGINGSPKANAMPVKDADGKFPCPNCNKTYLHAKHLKRHMLRREFYCHPLVLFCLLTFLDTGDRPYMCVLCNDTFSRSDILKRHFQKCSVRRGNPTGASHLSNPAAHLKKSQAAAVKTNTDSPASTTTPSTAGLPGGPYTSAAMGPGPMTSTSAPYSEAPSMPYHMAAAQPNDMRPPPNQSTPVTSAGPNMGTGPNPAWSMHNDRNPVLYNTNSTAPNQFAMGHGGPDEKRGVMQAPHQMHHEEWQNMFQTGANDGYMNPMFTGYDQSHHDVKKDFAPHEGGQNGYYVSSTSLGADGTLGTPLWHLVASQEDPLQLKADRLVDFCFPAGIQESLQEQQNNFHLRSCLSVESIKHFLELFSNFQGHFPFLHMPTFNFLEAYDGVILAIICLGAVYSDRVTPHQVRGLLQRTKQGIERTSRLWNADESTNLDPHLMLSGTEFEELQALLLLHALSIWHGNPEQRLAARTASVKLLTLIRQLNMLDLASMDDSVAFSYLHHLPETVRPDPTRWNWRSWIEQEKRSRFMFLVFLYNASLVIYFNCEPQLWPEEMRLPLPCDDAAWDAPDSESCACALGLRGSQSQQAINRTGSLRPNQMEMWRAMAELHDTSQPIEPRRTNVYSKFILIHALHIEIWDVQRQQSISNSAHASPTVPSQVHAPVQPNALLKSVSAAINRWKQSWDQDMQLQYPPTSDPSFVPRRFGFCRDGVHFYWLAQALMQPNRIHDWRVPADVRFQQVMNGLKKAREWSRSDGAKRGEEPGSVYDIDDEYGSDGLDLDMRKLFRPLSDVFSNSPWST